MRRADSLEKTLTLKRSKARGEGDNRGQDGWMASRTQQTWVWANSGRQWWTEKPGVLQSMGLTELSDWTITKFIKSFNNLSIRMAIQKTKYCQDVHFCWWECKMVELLWKRVMTVSQNTKNRTTVWFRLWLYLSFGYISKKIESMVSNWYLHTHVHSNIIYNSQKLEATQMSTNGQMDKQNVVYKCPEVLHSFKGWHLTRCYKMGEAWGPYAKWNKSAIRRQIPWFYLYKASKVVDS